MTLSVRNGAAPDGDRPLANAGGGYGLIGLRERTELAGGTLHRGSGRRRLAGGGADPDVTIRVVVADDQTAVREGLVLLLGLLDDVEVVGCRRRW